MKKVSVVGLGYVGLPLALLADQKGFEVTGIDVSKDRVEKLRDKISPIKEGDLQKQLEYSQVEFSDSFSGIDHADITLICVPTPVDENKLPDFSLLRSAVESVSSHLKKGSLLVIESTINPGVCDELVIPIVEDVSGYKSAKDIFVAHCPERINPGDPTWNVSNIARVVGADSEAGLNLAVDFYEKLLDANVKKMKTLKEAEAVKIVENSFRDINIAFVNELAMSFHKLGINLENVIDGAATKPFSFLAHHPGAGVGGHCIPVDPYYLIEHAKGYGFEHKFLKLARAINNSMPEYTVDLLEDKIKKADLQKEKTSVGLLGLSYKKDVGDTRESPAIDILNILKDRNYNTLRYDPFVQSMSDEKTLESTLSACDVVIIATGHSIFRGLSVDTFKKYGVKVVIDGRNIFSKSKEEFEEKNIQYSGIGV